MGLMADFDWRAEAVCLGADLDVFEAAGRGSPPVEGLRLCRGCPVRRDCLDEALSWPETKDYGVWGGTTVAHRRKIRWGGWTPERAMSAGDRLCEFPTAAERIEAA